MDAIGRGGSINNTMPLTAKVDQQVSAQSGNEVNISDGRAGSVEEKPKEMAGWKRSLIKFTDRLTGTAAVIAGGALGTAGLYVGAAGGAIALGIVGLGLGPAIAAVTTTGVLSGIGSVFGTLGAAGKLGLVAGSALTGFGMFKTGKGIVDAVGTGVRKILGAPSQAEEAGEVGAPKKPGLIETIIAGVGAVSGIAGGAIAGAGVAAAGATIAGLMATGVTLAAITGPAALGAAIGGAAFGIGGFVGSWSAIDKVKGAAKKIYNKFFNKPKPEVNADTKPEVKPQSNPA